MLLFDGKHTLAPLDALFIQQLVLPLVKLALQLQQNLLAQLAIAHVLCHLGELNERLYLLLLVFDKAADIEQFLVHFEVLGRHRLLPLDPAVKEIGLLL